MGKATKPSQLDPTDQWLAKGQKTMPALNLPDGRFLTVVNRRSDQASISIIGKGGTIAVMDTTISPDQYRYEWTHAAQFGVIGKPANTSPGAYAAQDFTEDDCKRVAGTVPLTTIEANEIGEGFWGMPLWAPQKAYYYKARRDMAVAAGKTIWNFGTYGGFENFNGDPWLYATDGNPNVPPNDQRFKAKLQSTSAARASCEYFARFEQYGVGAIVKNYADTLDYAPDFYRKMYAALVMGKGMGKVGGIGPGLLGYLDWSKIEGLGVSPGDITLGQKPERYTPGGTKVVSADDAHTQVEYDWLVMCRTMIGMALCNGVMPFDERSPIWGVDPNSTSQTGYPTEPQRWHDSGFEAAYFYSLCNRTEGVSWKECRWRFEGSETWIEPTADYTGLLDAAAAFGGPYGLLNGGNSRRGRPYALYRDKGNAVDVMVGDASQAVYKSSTIILNPVPNVLIRCVLPGCTMAMYNETI
ncbi:hypothetical protein [Spirosoma aerolatum]|uniref:hypothetical protein n=1 Tax=Spirosoma aerolatum TaxID=1211326 RepID=UPI0009AC64A5|nr:hypothetical protein [Spirosoma aerolatum]